MSKTIFLVLTSAIAISGGICRKGSLVEVSELEAKNLLGRGKARLATVDDGAPVADESADDGVDLSKLNKAQLSELATSMGIEPGELTKAELVAAIEAKQSEAE